MAHTATTRADAFEPLTEKSEKHARLVWGLQTEDGSQKPLSKRAFHLATYWFGHEEHNDVEAFLAWFPVAVASKPINDPYPEWHANTTDFELVTRLHLLRLYHNWNHATALCQYLDALGVESPPDQSTLYNAWHERFTEQFRQELRETIEQVVRVAKIRRVDVSDRLSTAEEATREDEEPSASSQRKHARETTKEIWQTAKPLVGPVVEFDRPDDTRYTTMFSWSYTHFWAVERISTRKRALMISSKIRLGTARQPDRTTVTVSVISRSSSTVRITARR